MHFFCLMYYFSGDGAERPLDCTRRQEELNFRVGQLHTPKIHGQGRGPMLYGTGEERGKKFNSTEFFRVLESKQCHCIVSLKMFEVHTTYQHFSFKLNLYPKYSTNFI